ncbi:hypothetical protein DY000_02055843 [Brassica cretica]|uniref:Uncharacterized protein n=1 Tax=Brassica cretica TaxID=69181 RepID=A0ABQ7ADT0_BRACR|nr:hypothetical protein DY000_02055843 [Brassica cretica]
MSSFIFYCVWTPQQYQNLVEVETGSHNTPRQSNDSVLCLDNIRSVQLFSPTNDIDLTPIFVSQYAMDSLDVCEVSVLGSNET